MRLTLLRLVLITGLIGIFFVILRWFPGLPFLSLTQTDLAGVKHGAEVVWNFVRSPGSWFGTPNDTLRGPWMTKLNLDEKDVHHIEYYCEAPPFNLTLDTQEILHGMQVLIRHGDRGALFDVKEASHSNCPYEETYDHPELLHSYYDLSSSLKSLDADKHDFRLVPEKTGCINGQLTSKGVMQHLQLGSAVRQRLGKVAADWITDDTEVYSTFYPRTYQSALAFMYGMDPSSRTSPRPVQITPPDDHQFCTMAGTCECAANSVLIDEYLRLKMKYFTEDQETFSLITRLREILTGHLEAPLRIWPAHVFDVMLQFACHGKHLPCYDGTCVTYKELVDVISILEKLADRLSEEPAVKQYSLVDAYGLLKRISNNFEKAVGDGDRAKTSGFTLFSAHDSTIVPMIHTLGLPFKIVIPYASHVIYELYSVSSYGADKDERFIRIIYNGEDITMKTVFADRCGYSKNRCLFSVFRDFVNQDLKKEFTKICTAAA